jgi:hypothetical protein
MSKKSATDIISEAISSFVAEAKGEPMTIHIHSDGKKIGEVSPEDFRKSTSNKHSFLADLVKDFNSQKEAQGEPERASIQLKKANKKLTESDNEREAFVRSLQLAPGDRELSHKELQNFASRSRGFSGSPAQVSAIADINSMNDTRLKQVIAHPKVHVFMKHRARKRLSKEWD